jgi:hypothetical protein
MAGLGLTSSLAPAVRRGIFCVRPVRKSPKPWGVPETSRPKGPLKSHHAWRACALYRALPIRPPITEANQRRSRKVVA